jgi:pimeloyl-ACP methyl ester carboxylesterase
MATTVVMVHGIRTSATMWRAQVEHLHGRGIDAVALDLPGHGARMGEPFTLDGAFATIDGAVRDAANAVVCCSSAIRWAVSCPSSTSARRSARRSTRSSRHPAPRSRAAWRCRPIARSLAASIGFPPRRTDRRVGARSHAARRDAGRLRRRWVCV